MYMYTENYKTLIKETEGDSKEWKDTPYFQIGRINIVKMVILPKADQHEVNDFHVAGVNVHLYTWIALSFAWLGNTFLYLPRGIRGLISFNCNK